MSQAFERVQHAALRELPEDEASVRAERMQQRALWFVQLDVPNKELLLLELEAQLRGLAAFGSVRNRPGLAPEESPFGIEHVAELNILHAGITRVSLLCRDLLAGDPQTLEAYTRHADEATYTVGANKVALEREYLEQRTPSDALLMLRDAFERLQDVTEGVLRAGKVSERVFLGVHSLVVREIGRNPFFNPLRELTYAKEFEHALDSRILSALPDSGTPAAVEANAHVFLLVSRIRRVVRLAVQNIDAATLPQAYILLAGLRSDVRALVRFLSGEAANLVAQGLEQQIMSETCGRLKLELADFEALADHLVRLRTRWFAMAGQLRLAFRFAFESALVPVPTLAESTHAVAAMLRGAEEIVRTASYVESDLLHELEPAQRHAIVEPIRARKEIWMLMQVVRAFIAMAEDAMTMRRDWVEPRSVRFVQDYVQHFRLLGLHLLRQQDYRRLMPYLESLGRVREVDLIDPDRLAQAAAESKDLLAFLQTVFDGLDSRAQAQKVPFDKQDAKETLRVYLSANIHA